MDGFSHLLMGGILQAAGGVEGRRAQIVTIVCAALPDLPSVVVYPLLGHANGRPFWIPQHADWEGLHVLHPWWAALWDVPHSLLFLALVVAPLLLLLLKAPRMAVWAYLSHIVIDTLVHTGEWAVRLFYPLAWAVDGVTDAWLWPPWAFAVSWAVLLGALVLVRRLRQRRARKGVDSGGE